VCLQSVKKYKPTTQTQRLLLSRLAKVIVDLLDCLLVCQFELSCREKLISTRKGCVDFVV
jgi:hypothetical protein